MVLNQTLFRPKNLNRVIIMYCINICFVCSVIELHGKTYWLDSNGVQNIGL